MFNVGDHWGPNRSLKEGPTTTTAGRDDDGLQASFWFPTSFVSVDVAQCETDEGIWLSYGCL